MKRLYCGWMGGSGESESERAEASEGGSVVSTPKTAPPASERRRDVAEIDALSVDRPRDGRLDLGREVENDGDEIIRINEDLVDQRRVRESVEGFQREPQPTPILLLRDARSALLLRELDVDCVVALENRDPLRSARPAGPALRHRVAGVKRVAERYLEVDALRNVMINIFVAGTPVENVAGTAQAALPLFRLSAVARSSAAPGERQECANALRWAHADHLA